jgi:glycosyltransferase involved in cell wall biosynthesis
MKIADSIFDKIVFIVPENQYKIHPRFLTSKMVVYKWNFKISLKIIVQSIPFLVSSITLKELYRNRLKTSLINRIKIVSMDVFKSTFLNETIKNVVKEEKIVYSDSVFYSYWNDYKALALARIAISHKGVYISRAHASDIFDFRSSFNYLPYKNFILKNLNMTFSISQLGKLELHKYVNVKSRNKISISRLGKKNHRTPLFEKKSPKIIVCSCSHFNSLKRVHLIPKILKKLEITNLHWVHFGWGYPEYEQLVKNELKDAAFTYDLKGITENEEILNYYSNNYVDFFINTSEHEGVPVSIMEAFSAGIPAIATNVGAVNEIIDESCGLLIEKNFEIDDVAQNILKFLNQNEMDRMNFRKSAFEKWKNEFEVNKNYLNFYNEIKSMFPSEVSIK